MITVTVPCSTSNLGPGFDTLGLALNRFVVLNAEPSEQLSITVEGNGADHIARDRSNLVYHAFAVTAEKIGKQYAGLSLRIQNSIPAFGGLGGSGAAIAGGVFLANELFNGQLSTAEMLSIAVQIEGHPDNVSAALYGGLTINAFDQNGNVHCTSISIDQRLHVVACSPHFQVQTKEARKILPEMIPMKDAVVNIENASMLVAALIKGDFGALRYATADRLHEKYRSRFIPGYDEMKRKALEAGALSFNISGAGPTVFAFTAGSEQAVAEALTDTFRKHGQQSTAEILSIVNTGATRL